MNKLTKVLSVFLLAGALGASVAGATACKGGSGSGHKHEYQYTVNATDSTKHDGHCDVDGCDKPDITEGHHWNAQNKCAECDATKPTNPTGEKFNIPATVDGIIVEGITQETVTLSTTKTSHTIDTSAIKVYLATDDVKGTEVPAANVIISVKKPGGTVITELSGLKEDGAYTVDVSLDASKCEMAQGAAATVGDLKATVTVTISNPVQQGSLVVKQGSGVKTTQAQSSTDEIKPTWTYEVTLANGDKKDVPAAEVVVSGLDTTKVTESGVATLTWGTITGTQSYTITANENLVAQSFAVNFGELTDEQKTKLKTEDVSIQGGRFVVQATSGEVADHRGSAPDFDGKYLASRLKMGGKYDGDNAKRYVKITTDGEATITVYGYANSGTAGKGAAGRFLSLYKNVTYGPKGGTDDSKIVGAGSDLIGAKQDTLQKENTKHEWSVTEAGTYWLVCETGDVCITYIQVDQLVTKADGVEAITLAGETKLAKLSVKSTTADYKQTFTVGDKFSVSEEYTVEGIYYNNVTMAKVKEEAVTTGITYWLGDTQLTTDTTLSADLFDKLGEQKITVKVDGETVSVDYTVVVESAVPGVTGITASVKSTVETEVETAEAKTTLNKTDIEAVIAGENANATVTITSVKYKAKDADDSTLAEITDSVELGVGDYVIVVTATVEDTTADKSASFETTTELKITKKLGDDEAGPVSLNVNDLTAGEKYTADEVLKDEKLAKITALIDCNVEANTGTTGYTNRLKTNGGLTTTKKAIKVELKEKATIKIIYKKGGTSRTAGLYGSDGTALQQHSDAEDSSSVLFEYTFTAVEAGTYYLGGTNGINFYEIIITPAE